MSLIPRAPKYAPSELASFELRDYRSALEGALANAPQDSAERIIIRNRLLAVVSEQAERAQNPQPSGTWADAS